MFRYLKTAIRFFSLGVAAGILIAPRAGQETRQLLKDKFARFLEDAADLASLAWPVDDFDLDGEELKPVRPRKARASENNGRGQKRTTRDPVVVG